MNLTEHKYGMEWKGGANELQWELECFRQDWPTERGGLGRFGHYKKLCEMLHPEMQWNAWLERQVRALCGENGVYRIGDMTINVVAMVGCASAGKTFSTNRFAFHWWLAARNQSICILTSTTKDGVAMRMWPVIRDTYYEARRNLSLRWKIPEDGINLGNFVDSRKRMQATQGDDKHAICAIAVREGETAKAESFIRGQHAERIFVAIDEANETPEAIYSALPNLQKAPCKEMIVAITGNPVLKRDNHGLCCEPLHGWRSRGIGQHTWKTKPVSKWMMPGGTCLQFRGPESPNVKAGRTLHKFIYTYENHIIAEDKKGELTYWKNDAGEWPPEGFCRTVFTEDMVDGFDLQGTVTFNSWSTPIAFLDPGFGGDACVFKHGKIGDLKDGRLAILLLGTHELKFDGEATNAEGRKKDVEHQICEQVVELCKQHGVKPENFGIFATGTGRGAASVLFTDWSDDILKVEEGGNASDLPASADDPRPACEVYDRRVTELHFSAREFARGGQLKGLDTQTISEFCCREYEMTGKPAKYKIETKDKCKPKIGHSPDDSDTVAGLVELARVRFGAVAGSKVLSSRHEARRKEQSKEAKATIEMTDFSEENDLDEVNYQERMAVNDTW